ncbi:hypothetical protein [Flavobacterium sp.]|jgi:hypothetical protein|uniref:hypothetical protein n=1 Tax=Flavobacterium sp. TaxID=239 RepID=UPI0037C05A9B
MSCPRLSQDGGTYGTGKKVLYNGYCECSECEETREEEEAKEEQPKSSGVGGLLSHLIRERVNELKS